MSKPNYKYFSIALDLESEKDLEVLRWMKENHSRQLKYSDMLREAMRDYIKKQKKKQAKS